MRSPSAPTADASRPGVIRRLATQASSDSGTRARAGCLLPPIPHTNWVAALAFQPDGKVVAAGDYDGLVRFWDTSTGKEIGRPLPQGEMVLSLAYSPDGTMLAVGLASEKGKTGTRLWDNRTRQPLGELLPSTDVCHPTRIPAGWSSPACGWQQSLDAPVGHDPRAGDR